jgi:hypothetical protein
LREPLGGGIGVTDVRNPATDWTREGADPFRVQPSPDVFADRLFLFGETALSEWRVLP